MAPLGLYEALAGSASIFIGIVTALLVNNLSNRRSERGRIKQRFDAIEARVESLKSVQDRLQKEIDEIEETWKTREKKSAEADVESFVDDHVGSKFLIPVEMITFSTLKRQLAEFLDYSVDELSEHHISRLDDFTSKIEAIIVAEMTEKHISGYKDLSREEKMEISVEQIIDEYRDSFGIDNVDERMREQFKEEHDRIKPVERSGPFADVLNSLDKIDSLDYPQYTTPPIENFRPMSEGIVAAEMQNNKRNKLHEEDLHKRTQQEKIRVGAEIDSLETEKSRLVSRFQALDPADLKGTVSWCAGSIVLSVLIPLAVRFLHAVGAVLTGMGDLAVLEPILVGIFWLAGILLVFYYLWSEVTSERISLGTE